MLKNCVMREVILLLTGILIHILGSSIVLTTVFVGRTKEYEEDGWYTTEWVSATYLSMVYPTYLLIACIYTTLH